MDLLHSCMVENTLHGSRHYGSKVTSRMNLYRRTHKLAVTAEPPLPTHILKPQ